MIGYLIDPAGLGRIIGLFLGGFWHNMALFIFVMINDNSLEAWERIYFNFPIAVAVIAGVMVGIWPPPEMRDDAEVELKTNNLAMRQMDTIHIAKMKEANNSKGKKWILLI